MFKKRTIKGLAQTKRKLAAQEEDEDSEEVGSVLRGGNSKRSKPNEQKDNLVSVDESKPKVNSYVVKEKEQEQEELQLRRKEKKELEKEVEGEIGRESKLPGFVKPISRTLKTVTITDYQPDVCKDFRKTGFCGYGDSCKFLHSRDDFEGGWKLNQNWNIEEQDNKNSLKELEDIPFKCVICEDDYKMPIVTKCQHYFCSSCFMDKMRTSTDCPICGKETEGVAKVSVKLKKLAFKR